MPLFVIERDSPKAGSPDRERLCAVAARPNDASSPFDSRGPGARLFCPQRVAYLCVLSALLLIASVVTKVDFPHAGQLVISSASAAEPAGMAQCASRDLRLLISIEAHGEAQEVPGDRLGEAFFTMMNARRACAAGRIDEALAIYDSIVVVPDKSRRE